MQRFISQDPLGFGGGHVNLYAYVGGDPINATDPLGQFDLGGLTADEIKAALEAFTAAEIAGLGPENPAADIAAIFAVIAVTEAANETAPSTAPAPNANSGPTGSGLVVIGKGADDATDVFGDTPNIAARVQAVADASTVAITDTTHRLVSGLFVVEDRGSQELKGIERPLKLYSVVRPSGMRGRFRRWPQCAG
jgi:class 3 adenylate cyclase